MKDNKIKLTESELHTIIREAVENVLNENLGKSSQMMVDIVNQIKAFEDSNHIIYQSPHPSSTEQQVRSYISQARDLLSRAAWGLKSLGY